ncbi:MAG TPA: NAD(P)-dependent oxidoreductase [Terrimicrobiaceae bacterium]
MKIDFTEIEQPEQDFFKAALAEHDLRFLAEIREVGVDSEILCIYITSPIDAAFLERHPNLKLIITRSAGHDHIDVSACSQRSVIVCELPGSNANTVAEHTFALMLALSRRVLGAREAKKETRFSFERWRGFELENKTLGVIGTGQIGQRVIHLGLAFGMRVLAYDPYHQTTVSQGIQNVSLAELLRESHIITLHTPLTAETFHLLDRIAFAQCRRGVLIINTARGAVIDTDALIEALDAEIIGGAGLDVLEEESVMREDADKIVTNQIIERLHNVAPRDEAKMRPSEGIEQIESLFRNERLLGQPNVVFTPHVAFNSVEAVERMLSMTVENVRAFIAGKPINVVT